MEYDRPGQLEDFSIFPEEGWFYYWKCSSSLWEGKIQQFHEKKNILIPIFWGFHAAHPNVMDFGQIKPEANLKKLADLIISQNKDPHFLLPLSPIPFFDYGGVPKYSCRYQSTDKDSLAQVFLDAQGNINGHYSFFDPEVFKIYKRFIRELKNYLMVNGVKVKIYGFNGGYLKKDFFNSYLKDNSMIFKTSMSKFLANENTEKNKSKENFNNLIFELYQESAKHYLSDYWEGEFYFSFLGGEENEILYRQYDSLDYQAKYAVPAVQAINYRVIPTLSLLSPSIRSGLLSKMIKDIVFVLYENECRSTSLFEGDMDALFRPLYLFELYFANNKNAQFFNDLCILKYLKNRFEGAYLLLKKSRCHPFDDIENFNQNSEVFIFSDTEVDEKFFLEILKLFMNGKRVIIDYSQLESNIRKRLNLFLYENRLKVETYHYLTDVSLARLGQGILFLFDGRQLINFTENKRTLFWEKLLSYLNIAHPKIIHDEGLSFTWQTRQANPNERRFEEIRKLSIYNATSYRRKLKLLEIEFFELIEIQNEKRIQVRSSIMGLDFEFGPGGHADILLGHKTQE